MSKTYHHHVRLRHTIWDDISTHKIYDLTLAIRIDRKTKEKEGGIIIGAAVVSRRDCYSKKEGNNKAGQRLMYNPTFTFPLRHKNEFNSMKYWIDEITGIATHAPTYLRDLILQKQSDFDKTEFGIQIKKEKNRREAEEAAAHKEDLELRIKEGRESAPARRATRKLKRAERERLKNLK